MRRLSTFLLMIALLAALAVPIAAQAPTATEAETTSVRTDILSGVELTVEEVEPGVFHVLDDGVRDLDLGGNTDIVAGHDDGIYLLRKNRFHRLGSEIGQAWPKKDGWYHRDFEVTPEGTVWVIESEYAEVGPGALFSTAGDDWTRTPSPPGDGAMLDSEEPSGVTAIEVAPEGTLWASWWGEGARVGYLGMGGWQLLDGEIEFPSRLYPTTSGDLFAENCGWGCEVLHFEDGTWSVFGHYDGFDVAPDGTIWFLGRLGSVPADVLPELVSSGESGKVVRYGLYRITSGELEGWAPDDLPVTGLGIALEEGGTFMAAPDGSLWASLWQRGNGAVPPAGGLWTLQGREAIDQYDWDPQCDGLVRFDGETADRFLPGRCVTMDIAADGSVWVLADEEKGKGLYVITPEAVAGKE